MGWLGMAPLTWDFPASHTDPPARVRAHPHKHSHPDFSFLSQSLRQGDVMILHLFLHLATTAQQF